MNGAGKGCLNLLVGEGLRILSLVFRRTYDMWKPALMYGMRKYSYGNGILPGSSERQYLVECC